MEFSAGDFVKEIVDFSNIDQISVVTLILITYNDWCPHFTDHPMVNYHKGKKGVMLSYLINQVPKSHPRMLVMACFL
jgi:hypothetical protein